MAMETAQKNAMLRIQPHRSLATTWGFRLLHFVGLILTVPVVAAARVVPGRPHDETVFVQANRTVLTALGFAYMS